MWDDSARVHVQRAPPPPKKKKTSCYISTTTRPIMLRFGTHIETYHLRDLRQSKGECICMCARATYTTPQKIQLLYLNNHLADRAEIRYTHRDPAANGFALVKSGMHLHVRTCHVHNPSIIPLLYLDNHLTDRAQIWYAH